MNETLNAIHHHLSKQFPNLKICEVFVQRRYHIAIASIDKWATITNDHNQTIKITIRPPQQLFGKIVGTDRELTSPYDQTTKSIDLGDPK